MDAFRRICLAAVLAVVGWLVWAGAAGANGVGRANLDGSGVQPGFITMASPPGGVDGVAVDGGHIYWANPSAHAIGRANLNGSGVDPSFLTVPLPRQHGGIISGPYSVAVGGGHIYWQTSEAIPLDGGWSYVGRANLNGTGVEPNFQPVSRCVRGAVVARPKTATSADTRLGTSVGGPC